MSFMRARPTWDRACAVVLICGCAVSAAAEGNVVDAARTGDQVAVRALIRRGGDVNVRSGDGTTALMWAVHGGHDEVVSLLLERRADPNARNDYGLTALHLAAENGSGRVIAALLAAGADPGAASPGGETPLMTAARAGTTDGVKRLLAAGAAVDQRESGKGQTALMWAATEGHRAVVALLIEGGADPRRESASGFTALMCAAREGHIEIVRDLLARLPSGEVNRSAPDGVTPLLIATVRGHVELAMLLLEAGASPDGDYARAGYTPLHWACGIFEGRLSYDYQNAPGEWAALSGIPDRQQKLRLIRALLAAGANLESPLKTAPPRYGFSLFRFKQNSLTGGTPFLMAAQAADVDVMQILAAAGADVSKTAHDMTTPLILASGLASVDAETRLTEREHLAAVELLLSRGADVAAANKQGFTALHAAAYAGYDDIIRVLHRAGAPLNVLTRGGQSALGIAEGNTLQGFFFARRGTADTLRKLGAQSVGAVTLDEFTKKQTQSAAPRQRAVE